MSTSSPAETSAQPAPGSAPAGNRAGLGIFLMLMAMLAFSLNDTMGKWLVSTYTVGQVMLLRSFAALVVLAPMVWRMGPRNLLRVERPKLQVLRVVCSTFEAFCFYAAVVTLPLADVMTYWLATPIYVAALSPLLLGEKVGWRRWTAIAVGFGGVIVALEPSAASLTLPALISVIGSFVFALTIIFGRQLRGTPDTVLVTWHFSASLVAGLATVPFAWVTPTPIDFGLLSLLGVVAMLAHAAMNRSLKLADASMVAPLQYTLLFWALIFGFIFFGELPRPTMMLGAAIIVASGLFIVFRERQLGKTPAVPADPH